MLGFKELLIYGSASTTSLCSLYLLFISNFLIPSSRRPPPVQRNRSVWTNGQSRIVPVDDHAPVIVYCTHRHIIYFESSFSRVDDITLI